MDIATNITDYVRPPHTISTLWYDYSSSNRFKSCIIPLYFIEN